MIKRILISLIYFYRKHKKRVNVCRFTPSCSEYAILAIEKYGTVKGATLAVKRICRCKYPNGGEDYP
ncbi:membrane protein insertion efficiency factor YidD [Ignatzschineria larvae DSM 13226]|uniref:Membrane protein insertion efficiency factor YidD n=1 Tax=Ignatzschineria larvae DSM 13226 TaxID=1111732 RepID=A0ABZ3BWY5_9GAMM|nr:membrane protein insertion efficiency factor YidD [Ignatzschineria larvae]